MSAAASSEILPHRALGPGARRSFQRGQALFTEGDLAERVFLIERGWVTVTSTGLGGREIVLALRGRGDMLGELSTLDGESRSGSALALSDVEALVVSGAARPANPPSRRSGRSARVAASQPAGGMS